MAKNLFSVGQRYQWITLSFLIGFVLPVPFWLGHKLMPSLRLDYINTAVIGNFVGLLNVGINRYAISLRFGILKNHANRSSVTTAWFVIGAFSQFYLRKYRPNW
jgi:hypothetical protein